MAGRHSKSKHRLDKRQDDHRVRRTVDMVDLRTGLMLQKGLMAAVWPVTN
jgi:hypothetical protein